MAMTQTRRRFLSTLSAVGAAGLVRAPRALAAEAALETTTVRLTKSAAICIAPEYVAEEFLRAEGFTDIRYVDLPETTTRIEAIARGTLDSSLKNRRQEEFNNRGAEVRRRVDRRSVGWLCRRGRRRLRGQYLT